MARQFFTFGMSETDALVKRWLAATDITPDELSGYTIERDVSGRSVITLELLFEMPQIEPEPEWSVAPFCHGPLGCSRDASLACGQVEIACAGFRSGTEVHAEDLTPIAPEDHSAGWFATDAVAPPPAWRERFENRVGLDGWLVEREAPDLEKWIVQALADANDFGATTGEVCDALKAQGLWTGMDAFCRAWAAVTLSGPGWTWSDVVRHDRDEISWTAQRA